MDSEKKSGLSENQKNKNSEKPAKKTSKTPKTRKYYYTKASILRSAIIAVLCFLIFVGFFVCFMIYGGTDRNIFALYKFPTKTEKKVLSMVNEIDADGNGRIYTFYEKTLEVNAYDEKGNFLESYQVSGKSTDEEIEICESGIVCENGYFYIINELGDVFMYKDGKSVRWISRSENLEECERIIKLHEEKEKFGEISVNGKTYRNNFVSVTDGEGNVIYKNFFVGLFFSPFSMVMAIIMTLVTYQAVRRYNKKVRNEKIKTIFSKKVIVK